MLRTGFPAGSEATQWKVIDKSPFRVAWMFLTGKGVDPFGTGMLGPSIIKESNWTVPTVACRISCERPTSIAALFAASAITQAAPGTADHTALLLPFS